MSFGHLTVDVVRRWDAATLHGVGLEVANTAAELRRVLRDQFVGSTALHDVWVSKGGAAAQLAAQHLANSLNGFLERLNQAGETIDAFAASVEFTQTEIQSAVDSVVGASLPIQLGPDGHFPELTEDLVFQEASVLQTAGDALIDFISPPGSEFGTATQNKIVKPGWPPDALTKFGTYQAIVRGANLKIDNAMQLLLKADSQSTGVLDSVAVAMRAAVIAPATSDGVVAHKGDALWNTAVDAIGRNFGITPNQLTDKQISDYVTLLAIPQTDAVANEPFAPLSVWTPQNGIHWSDTNDPIRADHAGQRFYDGVIDGALGSIGAVFGAAHGVGEALIDPLDAVDKGVEAVEDASHEGYTLATDAQARARVWGDIQETASTLDGPTLAGNVVGYAVAGGLTGKPVVGVLRDYVPVNTVGGLVVKSQARAATDLDTEHGNDNVAVPPVIPTDNTGAFPK